MAILKSAKAGYKVIFIATALLLFAVTVHSQEQKLQLYEQKIKAGLVYNLLKYTTWPKESPLEINKQLRICIYGEDPFNGYLAPLEGRTAQQVPIFIRQIKSTKDVEQCNVIIVHQQQAQQLSELLDVIKGKNILTVSDIEQFAQLGGMIELAKEGDKISLYINKSAVTQAGLSIQDPMLKLAKIVEG